MSVNLHLSIRVSGYDPVRADAVKKAIQAVIERESLTQDMSPLTESGDGAARVLATRSNPDYPVIISSSYKWIPEVQASLSASVAEANGAPCKVEFEGEDADEGADEYDDEEDESE